MKTVKKLTDKQTAGIALDFKLKYKAIFLKLNKLKVGDKVITEFDYQRLAYNHKGKATNKVTFKKEGVGTLKEDKQGCLYIESDEDFYFYQLQTTEYRGKFIEQYIGEKRKSIVKLGSTTWIS
jgi:hypothetical protein